MKSVLLFLAGVLVGANVVYFLVVRPGLPESPDTVPAMMTRPAQPVTETTIATNDGAPVTPAPQATNKPATNKITPPPGQAVSPPTPAAPTPAAPAPATTTSPTGLLIPVQGVTAEQLGDTFNDTRGGGRPHEAQDIMAARGTPVLAASDGTIEKLFTSKRGGLTIYEFGPSRTHAYYYAHLDSYVNGLSEGNQIKRGQVIGYVGSTGNANADAPHLHFAIFVLGPEKHWWEGTAIDPYPLLGGK